MSTTFDLYGISGYDPNVVDSRHELLCPGCAVCAAAEERWERKLTGRGSRCCGWVEGRCDGCPKPATPTS